MGEGCGAIDVMLPNLEGKRDNLAIEVNLRCTKGKDGRRGPTRKWITDGPVLKVMLTIL